MKRPPADKCGVIEENRDAKPDEREDQNGERQAQPDDAAQRRREKLGEGAAKGGQHRRPLSTGSRRCGQRNAVGVLAVAAEVLILRGFFSPEIMGSRMGVATIDVVGIGNAIVDVIAHADESFLAAEGFAKGAMTLIDAARAGTLYGKMGPGVESSGGSAGNTMAGIASLGGTGAYVGKVRDDALGAIYRHDITAMGISFDTSPATEGPGTARCLILVTEDGQRTMGTYLGACVDLGPEDIDPATIGAAQITYLEGYLFDPPRAQEAFRKAAAVAHSAGRLVALSLSDPFCVGRHRDEFRELVAGQVDILFANESE